MNEQLSPSPEANADTTLPTDVGSASSIDRPPVTTTTIDIGTPATVTNPNLPPANVGSASSIDRSPSTQTTDVTKPAEAAKPIDATTTTSEATTTTPTTTTVELPTTAPVSETTAAVAQPVSHGGESGTPEGLGIAGGLIGAAALVTVGLRRFIKRNKSK